jgi:hypothetical protein
MVKIYVKYKVADYRGEDTISVGEEIDTANQKMYNQYKDKICFKKIEESYKDFNGVLSI